MTRRVLPRGRSSAPTDAHAGVTDETGETSQRALPLCKAFGGATLATVTEQAKIALGVAAIGAVGVVLAAIATGVFSGDGNGGPAPPAPVQPTKTEETPSQRAEPEGAITAPSRGANVPAEFTVEGRLAGIPRGRHVWLATQVNNLLFPKPPALSAQDREFLRDVAEGGSPPRGRFSLVLLMVNNAGNQQIEDWVERGDATGDFPGLEKISGSVRLDIVSRLALR